MSKLYSLLSLVIVSCVLSSTLSAQETYYIAWTNKPGEPILHTMIKLDINTGESISLFTINLERFDMSDKPDEYKENIISGFEFTKDKSQVYLSSELGSIYRYTISSNKLEFVTDVLPNVMQNGTVIRGDITLLNDSTLYYIGRCIGIYHINTNKFDTIVPFNQNDFESGKTQLTTPYSLVNYGGKYYATFYESDFTESSLYEYDLYNPKLSKKKFKVPLFVTTSLLSHPYNCDSLALLAWRVDYKTDIATYYRVDIETKDTIRWKSNIQLPEHPNFYSRQKSYPTYTWEECQRSVDLDYDDSTVPYLNYRLEGLCSPHHIPVCDQDVHIRNPYTLDSIVLDMENVQLEFPQLPKTMTHLGSLFGHFVIRRDGAIQNTDYEQHLQTLYGKLLDPSKPGKIHFTPWYAGKPGPTATTTWLLDPVLPDAGIDTTFYTCADMPLDTDTIYTYRSHTAGQLYDASFTPIDQIPPIDPATPLTVQYIAQSGFCADTSTITVQAYPIPTITPQPDYRLCPSDSITIDLSYTNGSIQWSDGSVDNVHTVGTSDTTTYLYTLTDHNQCQASDTFSIYSSIVTHDSMQYTLCMGDSMIIDAVTYTKGVYTDTIRNTLGCDSIVHTRSFFHYEEQPITLDGSTAFCEGDRATLTITSPHTDIQLNGNTVDHSFLVDKPGTYTLVGKDKHACHTRYTFDAVAHPLPVIYAPDQIDTVYEVGLVLPVSYSDDVERYTWTPAQYLSCTDCPQPSLSHQQQGAYTVTATDYNQCSTTHTIELQFKSAELLLPSVIANTPTRPENGVFFVKGDSNLRYNLEIYDRWGNIIFARKDCIVNDPSHGWTPAGKVNTGVFVYQIIYSDNETEKRISGTVSVM